MRIINFFRDNEEEHDNSPTEQQTGDGNTPPETVAPEFLLAGYGADPIPGSGSCFAYKLIPPREAVTDSDLLTEFFITLSALISNFSGESLDPSSDSARKATGFNQELQDWLNNLETEKNSRAAQEKSGNLTDNVVYTQVESSYLNPSLHHSGFPKLRRNSTYSAEATPADFPTATSEADEEEEEIEDWVMERILALNNTYQHPYWDNAITLEIVGRYQEVFFVLRGSNLSILEEVINLLRHEYPHLVTERLETDPKEAYSEGRDFDFAWTKIKASIRKPHKTSNKNSRQNQGLENLYSEAKSQAMYNKKRSASSQNNGSDVVTFATEPVTPEAVEKAARLLETVRKYDPLVVADDRAARLTATRWQLFAKHPAMPIATPGSATHLLGGIKNRTRLTESNTLRRVLALSSRLLPGEITSAQLLVLGPVPKEWVKRQEERAAALKELDRSGALGGRDPYIRTQRQIINSYSGDTGKGSSYSRSGSKLPFSGGGMVLGPFTSFLIGFVVAILLFFFGYLQLSTIGSSTDGLVGGVSNFLEGLGCIVLGFVAIFAGMLFGWSKRYIYPQQIQSPAAIEQKISKPPLLVASRLVASVPFEPYLAYVSRNYDFHFVEKLGVASGRAAYLYSLHNLLFEKLKAQEGGNGTFKQEPNNDEQGKLVIKSNILSHNTGLRKHLCKLTERDIELWEAIVNLAADFADAAVESLLTKVAGGYSNFTSGIGNAFNIGYPDEQPAVFSTIGPLDWIAPKRERAGLFAKLWPFNTPLFDAALDWGDKEVPALVKKFRFLLIVNAEEASNLFHLPGGTEVYDFLERTGPKHLSTTPSALSQIVPIVSPSSMSLLPQDTEDEGAENWEQGLDDFNSVSATNLYLDPENSNNAEEPHNVRDKVQNGISQKQYGVEVDGVLSDPGFGANYDLGSFYFDS